MLQEIHNVVDTHATMKAFKQKAFVNHRTTLLARIIYQLFQ